MSIRRVPHLKVGFFELGDVYSAKVDYQRFTAVENQLDTALSLTAGGILTGWAVTQTLDQAGTRDITIQPGFGIVPFTIDKVDSTTGKLTKEVHFLGVRTNYPIIIPSIGANKRNVIYVELNRQLLNLIQNNDSAIVDISEETINIVVRPPSGSPSGSGPFRTTSTTDEGGNPIGDEYPIYFRKIDGIPFDNDNNKVVVFVNDKRFDGGYFISGSQGNVIGFNDPLHAEDNVTVRIDPAYSLVIGEVLTDTTRVVDINNDIKEFAKEKSANGILAEELLTHLHDDIDNNPTKILLTTRTSKFSPTSSIDNQTFSFDKPPESVYGFNFVSGTYSIEVYVNNFLTTEQVIITDNSSSITIKFSSKLETTDSVKVVFVLNENQTQIKNKLNITCSNPSAEEIDFEISGDKIASEQLNQINIPKISHIGRSNEIFRPANDPDSSREYVHRTEIFKYSDEFFPVHKNKTNARNAIDLFFEQRSSLASKSIHSCASNGFLYMLSDNPMFILPENFIGGWSSIIIGDLESNEYDAPFKIIPIKDPINVTSNDWDRLFYVGNRFITQNTWETILNPKLEEIVNLSSDSNPSFHNITLTDLIGNKIIDACGGKSPLNMNRTAFILMDNRVYFYDYIPGNGKYFWLDMTSNPLWTGNAKSISCLDILGSTILFVGMDNGEVWCNILASANLLNNVNAGATFIPQGNISFKPLNIWENNEYSYGYGYGQSPSFFDIFNIRGNNFGYGNVGYDFGYEEKLPIKSGDDLLFITANATERKRVVNALDNSMTLLTNIQKIYKGQSSGLSNSLMMVDWFKISDGLVGTIKKVGFDGNKLIVLTDSKLYYSSSLNSIGDLFFIESYDLVDSSAPTDVFNDFGVIDTCVLIAAEGAIYKGEWTGLFYSWSISENSNVGTSINNILYPSNSIIVNGGDVYSCGKYGIFKSVNCGDSWRNTVQTIGFPEDRNSRFTTAKATLKVVFTDSSKNRIYMIESGFPYGYGYGYGYGEGADFFDVFGFSSSTYGYGYGSFESNFAFDYGYGYGFELINAINAININDWIYFDENSGSIYENIPLRILDSGIDSSNNIFFVEVELADAEKADFSEIVENQKFSIYRKKEPLALIDGIPQDVRYESTDIIDYDADYHRQSVIFNSDINTDRIVTIASEYKAFEPIVLDILSLSVNEVKINGLLIVPETRDINFDNFISLSDSSNIDDIIKVTIKGLYIDDVGELNHEELEDAFSKEELGLPYKFEGIRTSNLLAAFMAIQHVYPTIIDSEILTQIESSASSVSIDYITDNSITYLPNSLIGRRIILDSENKETDYTIESNTENNIYPLRVRTYEDFIDLVDGSTTSFQLRFGAVIGKIDVYLNSSLQTLSIDYVYDIISGEVSSIDFTTAPSVGSRVIVSYIKTSDNIDFSDIISTGQTYIIIGEEISPFKDLINTFVSMYKDESNLDVEFSFIENSIVLENPDPGIVTQASFYVYFNPLDENIYAGTNRGIWKRDKDISIYCKTSELISTIDATGPISIPDSIHGFYVQYDQDLKEWTITWGLGISNKNIGDNITNINITAINHNLNDNNIVLAGSTNALYRTMDGGITWNVVWDFAQDERISNNPIPRQIVFDDKNSWIVNIVNQSGLFRSFDYGNNFEKIASYDIENRQIDSSRSFTYQIDSSDVRGIFYYGENSIQYKNSKDISSFGEEFPSLVKTGPSDIIGISLGDLSINKIANRIDNVNTVFISSDVYGLLKSTVFGNDPQISADKFKEVYVNFTNELIDEFNNSGDPDNNTGAFHFVNDPDVAGRTVGRYRIFVDKLKNRTYILTKVEQDKKIPVKGEFIGKFISLEVENLRHRIYRIIEHYDRGLLPSGSSIKDHRGNSIPSHIIEFVLEGTYPFLYNQSDLPNDINSYNFYWYGDSEFSTAGSKNPQILQSGFKIPLFSQSNGSVFKPIIKDGNLFEINGTGLVGVSSLSDTFSASEDETIISIFYPKFGGTGQTPPAGFLIVDSLKNHLIGDIQSETKYRITNSKTQILDLEQSELFYAIINLRVLPIDFDEFDQNGFDDPIKLWNNEGSNRPPSPTGVNIQLAIYNPGEILSKTSNSITLKVGGLPTVASIGYDLTGYVLYPRSDSNVFFKIVSNTEDTIVVDSTFIDSLSIIGDFVRVGSKIQSGKVKDFIIDPDNNDIMYVAGKDNPYKSIDGGKTWRLINDGLLFNVLNGESVIKFEKLKINDGVVYACAFNYAPGIGGGIYRFGGITWSQIGGVSGDGFDFHSINDFSVFDEGIYTIIYAGTTEDGIYKGIDSGSGFVWSRMILPEHKVTAIETIKKENGDLERIWTGTDGRGIFRKDGLSDDSWFISYNNILKDIEIKSSIWRPWNIYESNGDVLVNSLFAKIRKVLTNAGSFDVESYFQTKYSPILGNGITDPDNFDWFANSNIDDDREIPQILSLDQSNSTYITESITRTITDVDSPDYHRLSQYISGIKGSGRKSEPSGIGFSLIGIGTSTNPLGIEKVNVSGNQKTIYEEPFSHLPDRQSITVIKEGDSGRVFFGTDRSGVWRTKSGNGNRYLLPFVASPTGAFSSTTYGYDFDSTKLERFRATIVSDFPNEFLANQVLAADPNGEFGFIESGQLFDGVKNSERFFRAEKIYNYNVDFGTDIFSDIDGINQLIIGGYLVIAENIQESEGVIGKRIVLEIVNCIQESPIRYKLYLSAGTQQALLPIGNISYAPWDELDSEIATPTGTYSKICIIDFEAYEDISGNLPKLNIKNSRGIFESGIFVRDMKVIGSEAAIACGIGGLYISKDINNIDINDIDWFSLALPTSGMDVTSVLMTVGFTSYGYGYGYGEGLDFFDVFGEFGAFVGSGSGSFEYDYSYSYGYGIGSESKLNIYISTWGDGVWIYKDGYWDGDIFTGGSWTQIDDPGLVHKNVWTIFISSEDILYAGTEHGGIYLADTTIASPIWTREIDNVVRSKLFLWKTEGVPSTKSTGLDYSDSSKLLTYSFGGGIMRSLDRGDTWEQVNTGLENYYVQDLAICSDSEDIVYAVTAGGGVFKTTNAFSGICSWSPASTNNLPSTLNIDQVEIGTDPDIIYIKARLNDLSYKDLPLNLKPLAEFSSSPTFDYGIWDGSLGSSLFNGNNFVPLQPYLNGNKKSILFRSDNGGDTWTSVYDKDPNLAVNYSFSSALFGLTITPGQEDRVQFLYKSSLTSNNNSLGTVNKFVFVTITEGSVESETAFPFDSYQNLKLSNQRSEAYISINPINIDEIYISLHGDLGSNRYIPPIYKSEDGGFTWNYASGHFTSSESFNNKIQISTKVPSILITSISEVSSSFNINGTTVDISKNTAQFDEAKVYYLQNFNSIMVASFIESSDPFGDSLFFTYRDEPVISGDIRYPRPFYLNGADLQINIDQSLTLSVIGGGNGTFLPKYTKNIGLENNPQFATFILDETYRANILNPILNTCKLSNLTSIKFDYSLLPITSILKKENSLIGLDIKINGNVSKIAIHRALYDSTSSVTPSKIELLIIGNFGSTFTAGTSVSITMKQPMYSNYDNDLMLSVNGGISWKKIGKDSFSIATDNVKGSANNTVLPVTIPATIRSTYIIRDEGIYSVIYRGDARDDRYSDNPADSLIWTQIGSAIYFKSSKILENGLAFDSINNRLYISELDKISKIDLNISTSAITVFSNIIVSIPVTISENNSEQMVFIANSSLYTTKDSFTTTNIINLPPDISKDAVKKVILSKNSTFVDEILLCVNGGQTFDQASSNVTSISSLGTENLIIMPSVANQTNPFNGFNGRILIFEKDGTNSIFTTKIFNAAYNTIYTINTVSSTASSFEYSAITNRTLITCNGVVNNIEDYIGNSFSLRNQQNANNFFIGRIEDIQNITNLIFDVIVSGDLRPAFSENNIDFNTKFPIFNIGKITDFLGTDFAGKVSSSRAAASTLQNGIWYSNTFGEGFSRIDAIRIGGIDDRPGCVDAHLNENGAISAIVVNSGITRIMSNNSFISSTNINRVLALSDGSVMALTDNGLSIVSGDDVISFSNFFFNDFRHVLDVEADQFYLFDSNGDSFILNGIPELFFGNEVPTFGKLTFINVNRIFKDSLDVIWVATEGFGVYAIFGTDIYNFTINNSSLTNNSIRDITQDTRGSIWLACSGGGVATGIYGDDVKNIALISWITFDTGIDFTGTSGLSGEVNAIKERIKLNIISNGTISPAQVSLRWINNSIIFPQTIILRSRDNVSPNLQNGTSLAFSPIKDSVLSITATINNSNQNVWRISGNLNIDYGTNNLIEKYIIPDTRNSDNNFIILSNSLNSFDIERTSSNPPSVGNFLITSKIDNSFIIYSGDGTDVNFNVVDSDIINNGIYYYFMFFFNTNNLIYKLSDGGQAVVSSTEINTDVNIDIICGGTGGIFRFTPSGNQFFEFIASFGDDNDVTDIFFDTANIGWIAAGNKLIEFNSPNLTTEYTVGNLFEGKSSLISENMVVNNAVERLDGKIVIATNVGLSIKTDVEFKSFINNDPEILYRNDDNSIKFDKWRPSRLLESNTKFTNFLKGPTSPETYLVVDRNVYHTNNNGISWSFINSSNNNIIRDDINFANSIFDINNEIIDYVLVGDRAFYSSGDSTFNLISLENFPIDTNSLQSFSAGDMWLSESIVDNRLLIGLYNNNVIEDEREISIIDFTNVDEFATPIASITGSDGLSIQSTYCFEELINGVDKYIFAGCKDAIVFKKNTDPWKTMQTGEVESDTFVYSSVVGRIDAESIEHEKIIYTKRSSIYSEQSPIEILSIKFDSILTNKVLKYNLDGSLAGFVRPNGIFSYKNQITKVDRNGFSNYNPQRVQRNIYDGHFGALAFLNSNRTLAIGGFANTLMIVPFTAEKSNDLFKAPSGVFSGLRGHFRGLLLQAGYPFDIYEGFDFPYEINEDVFTNELSFSSGLTNRTEANFLTKNKNAWSINFNKNDGYASYLFFGQNAQNKNKKFDFASEDNISYLMKTRDSGQFWIPISYDNLIYPRASISDYIFDSSDNNKITISTVNGLFEDLTYNSGVFFSDDGGKIWTNITDMLPKVPVKSIELIDSRVYSGPLGFGVYSTYYSDVISLIPSWEMFESRFPTENGINIGLWEVTSIDEDIINTNRLLVGTKEQGVVESLDGGSSWVFENNGIPSGYITSLKILNTNPFVVLAGLKNDGLYIKNKNTGKYEKKTTGLPLNYDVLDILIDTSFTDIFNEVNITNTFNSNIIVLRSDFNTPSTAPSNGTLYNVGDEIENSKVVYIGNEDFSLVSFKDRNGILRDGIPYYYRVFISEINGSYTEKGVISGISSSIQPLKIIDTSNARLEDPFPTSGNGLSGRITTPSSISTTARLFEIESNTGTELILKADPFKVLNAGDATRDRAIVGRQFYVIYSTFIVFSLKVNPIYIVAKDNSNNISKVYFSGDNGNSWIERNSGITSTKINSLSQEKLNIDPRLFLQETILYASTDDGVFKTVDNGVEWEEISQSSGIAILPNSESYRKVLVDGEDCSVVYAITIDGKIFRTVNEGETWESMIDIDLDVNVVDMISFFTNYIYTGTNGDSILRIENSVRDRVDVSVIADGNITFFDIDFFELGDSIDTDTNSITASTLVRNDSISQNKEQVRFKTKDIVENVEFYARRNSVPFNISDIFVGSQLDPPQTNPFILRVPGVKDDPTVINQIITLDDGLLYVASNKGAYFSENFGEKWEKIQNSILPDTIYDIGLIRNNELIFATKSGIWGSKDNRNTFGIVESSGKIIKTVFESSQEDIRNFIRGGENGLRISIENSRSIIAYSGDIGEDTSIRFSWGDVFNPKDGNWSENTQRTISEKILTTINPDSVNLIAFDGWDFALIVRKGPFITFNEASRAGENNDIFVPEFEVVYPNTISGSYSSINESAIFSTETFTNEAKAGLEEIRNANLAGNHSTGLSFNPKRYMSDGSIIVGRLPNRKRSITNFPLDFDQGPTPDTPIIDRVQSITDPLVRSGFGLSNKIPSIESNMFYLYRVYPYILVPEPLATVIEGEDYPKLPDYRPGTGDSPDAYGYNLEIDKFRGATTILSGITIGENNWIVGTDSGIFYSTQAGRDINLPEDEDIIGINFKVPALIKTSAGIVLAAVISDNTVYLARSINAPLGKNWEILLSTVLDFESANVHRIYNIVEDTDGFIYLSTNAGIWKGNNDGTGLILAGSVGDLESLTNGLILGQEIFV